MTFPHHDTDDDIEAYRIEDADGDLYAVITYFNPGATPGHRYDCWVVDFADGQRLTGDVANEAAKRLMNSPGTSGNQYDRNAHQTDSILDTVVYDDDSRSHRITWNGVRVWFVRADSQGDDIVLYADRDQSVRAGVLEAPPFDTGELKAAMRMAEREAGGR